MSIKDNFPAVRPQLLIDIANTDVLDPRVVTSRASVATYYDKFGVLQTADANEPRIGYNPSTGAVEGLIREAQGTNLLTYSEDFSNAVWTKASATITPNQIVAPDGTLTMDLMTATSTSTRFERAVTVSTNATYSYSIYAKSDGITDWISVNLVLFTTPTNTTVVYFDISNGVIGLVNGDITANIEPVENGIYRCSVTFTTDATDTTGTIRNIINQGNGQTTCLVGQKAYFWGASLEANAYPTSYIKTEASQVTRAADTFLLTNSSTYDTDAFTAISQPFGVTSVSSGTVTLNGDVPIERLYVYPNNIAQDEINSVVENDGWWSWRIVGATFALPNFTTDGSIQVDWGDGTVETLTTAVHAFTNASPHTVKFRQLTGTYFRPQINNNATYRLMIVAVGSAPSNMIVQNDNMFYGCANVKSFDATMIGGSNFSQSWRGCTGLTSFPLIDTSSGTSFSNAWFGCSSLTSFPLLNTSAVTNFTATWQSCTSLTSFPLIDTSSGTNFVATWAFCSSLTSFPAIDTGLGTNFSSTWSNCSSLTFFPAIDTSSGTNFSDTWNGCNSLTSFPLLDMSLAENLNECWDTCTSLTSFPAIDFPVCTNFTEAWRSCSSLTSFPLVDTSAGTTFAVAWNNCSSLTSFPLINTSSSTSFYEAWRGCVSLTSFPLIDTSSGTQFGRSWFSCYSLTSFPLIDTSKGTTFDGTWQSCASLTSFPVLDTSSGINFNSAWAVCSSLTSFPLIDTSAGTAFSNSWQNCTSLTAFPLISINAGTNFRECWRNCTSLTDFPANMFDSWVGVPAVNCFLFTWLATNALTTTSVENILVSIDTSGVSAPATGTEITIDYNVATGALTAPTTTAITSLKGKGWTIKINGVLQ